MRVFWVGGKMVGWMKKKIHYSMVKIKAPHNILALKLKAFPNYPFAKFAEGQTDR